MKWKGRKKDGKGTKYLIPTCPFPHGSFQFLTPLLPTYGLVAIVRPWSISATRNKWPAVIGDVNAK